jgi:IS30 family transposase
VLIDRVNELSALIRESLTWDQGIEMGRQARLILVMDLPVYLAHPYAPLERPSDENLASLAGGCQAG